MPDQPKTPQRAIRIPDKRWEATERSAKAIGSNRSEVVNDMLAWFVREPNAKLPKRPAEDD
jgi:hypothetical protein